LQSISIIKTTSILTTNQCLLAVSFKIVNVSHTSVGQFIHFSHGTYRLHGALNGATEFAGQENAGLENDGQNCRAGKCRTGK